MTPKQRAKLEAQLDGRQRLAAMLVVEREFAPESERKSYEQIAEEVGVSARSLWEWRHRNRAFIDYVNAMSADILASSRPKVYRQLLKLIDGAQPSVKAIDLYFKHEGLITTKTEIDVNNGNAGPKSNDELAAEIEELDELLADGDV
ncbi:hypothetical protein PACILC2_22680 [Paenibacillus cisolokensis]|uniref:Homeodomain phBC6A51-type domain-containing protein n=1 Tax=Paenibacillus cisolokensis TaxID=1658519 RepID=A0ABQ4N692_9BACL|nr:phBC6A51 family helix-turn-helix protein [Paenibacillus cisolokensis]GIQ63700.1 hypothetical protein PACILC2_22680 [Paenibacillus cisolokensis]